MAGLGLDFLKRAVNVHWGGLAFLYSGADGMFGSKDGEEWEKAPSSVPATSLAWVDDVWVACGLSGTWRSEDGAKTWESGGPQMSQVAAMKPAGVDSKGKPLPGMFAGIGSDDDGNGLVYTSSDGKSWGVALNIPASGADDSYEAITGLSGCGGAFFVGVQAGVNRFSANTARFYSSFDGGGFSSHTVAEGTFWDGDIEHVPPVFTGWGAGGVGFDKKTQMYLATIQKQVASPDLTQTFMQASTSASGSFDEGSQVDQAILVSSSGDFISVYSSAAGGDGTFVGGSSLQHFSPLATGGEVRAHRLPGGGSGQVLESYTGATSEEFIGSFCFKQNKDEETTDSPDTGMFACVAFGAGAEGGAYIATAGGSFQKTHAGQGFQRDGVGQPFGAVAVGKIKFLDSESST
jgi:hypothetical protein